MDGLFTEIQDLNIGKVKRNERLSQHTTMKIGGPADIFIEPASLENIQKVMTFLKEWQIPWRAIGRGSNLLVSDKGIEGVVIKLSSGLDHLTINDSKITVGGGHSLVSLSTLISKKGLSGLEFASGIPGSVGGAVYMNAGAHGSDISKILTKAHILFDDGSMEWLSNDEMEFTYRTSVLQKKRPGIVLEAEFQLTKGDKTAIVSQMQKQRLPKTNPAVEFPMCGKYFPKSTA